MSLISWNLKPRTAYLSIRSHAMERRSGDFTGEKEEKTNDVFYMVFALTIFK